jgi:hypothetical protein
MTVLVGSNNTTGFSSIVRIAGNPGMADFQLYTCTQSGTVTSLAYYWGDSGIGTENLEMFLCSNTGVVLASTGPVATPASGTQFVFGSVSPVAVTAGNQYYLGFYVDPNNDGGAGRIGCAANGSGSYSDTTSGTYASPPTVFSAISANSGNPNFLMYADGVVAGGAGGVLPLLTGPGVSPNTRTMFRPRALSSFIVQGNANGVASAQAFAFGQMTGANASPTIGYIRNSGPGVSPDWARTFQSIPRSSALTPVTPLTGVSLGSLHAFGTLQGTGSLQGLAFGQGLANAAQALGGAVLSGVANAEAVALGNLSGGGQSNMTGGAFGSAYAVAAAIGSGALIGVARGEGHMRAQLVGIGALSGRASSEGSSLAALNATAALAGTTNAEFHARGLLAGDGVLDGIAAGAMQSVGILVATGALSGRSIADACTIAGLTGAAALSGLSSAQSFTVASVEGVAQLEGASLGQSHALGLLLPVGAGQMLGAVAGFSFAYGLLSGSGHTFGWATVTAVSQNGLPVARACYLEQSACRVTATYYDSTGTPFVPNAVSYRVDDVTSGANIVPWTTLTPDLTNTVTITSTQNAMISTSRASEAHQVLFQITDGTGNVSYADVEFDLIRVPGFP